MHKKNFKDLVLRNKVKKTEGELYVVKALLLNEYCVMNVKLKKKLVRRMWKLGGSLVKVRNRCIVTGRARGIVRKYKVSRMTLKFFLDNKVLVGVRGSSF